MPVKAHITEPSTGVIAKVTDLRELVVTAERAIPVTFSSQGLSEAAAQAKNVNLHYDVSLGSYYADMWRRVVEYTVPSGYAAQLLRASSWQSETAPFRAVSQQNLATGDVVTGAFTVTGEYVYPLFAGIVQAEVTTALTAGAGNVVLTVTYTNENNIGGRTGTITIAKGAAQYWRYDLVFQTGDYGCKSIENIVPDVTLAAGAFKIIGMVAFAAHQNQSSFPVSETVYQPGAFVFAAGSVIGLEFQGGTVSKLRKFDVLLQLVTVT